MRLIPLFEGSSGRKVYRTDKAHDAYKGNANFGKGLYFGTDLVLTGNMQYGMEYNKGKLQFAGTWKPEDGGVDEYTLPTDIKLLKITIDYKGRGVYSFYDLDHRTKDGSRKCLNTIKGEKLKTYALNLGYDGVELPDLYEDEVPQIAVYNETLFKMILDTRRELTPADSTL